MLIFLGDGACLTLLKTHMTNPKNSGASPPLSVGLSVDFIHHRHLLAKGCWIHWGEKSGAQSGEKSINSYQLYKVN